MRKLIIIIVLVLIINFIQAETGWNQQTTTTNSLLLDVFFSDNQTGWAVGITNTILYTNDGGENWISLDPIPSVNYYSVHFTDSLTGCAVGATVGGSGKIRRTSDGGESWDEITGTSLYSLWEIYFSDSNNGWIAGGREYGFNIDPIRTIHNTSDGGLTWETQLYEYDELPLNAIHFYDENIGCAVGDYGTIYWTDNGGQDWSEQTSGTVNQLWGVYLIDSSTAWAVGAGGTILYTTNSGSSWNNYDLGVTNGFRKIIFTDLENGWLVGGENDEGAIYYTSDGGDTWIEQPANSETFLMGVHFSDSYHGWAVGNLGTIVHTTDGGGIVDLGDNTYNHSISDLYLSSNYPNPFNPETTIDFSFSQDNQVKLTIYNIKGQRIREYIMNNDKYKTNKIVWNGTDDNGKPVTSGLYFYKLKAGEYEKTKKMILMK